MVARLVAASSSTVAAIDAARWRQDLRSRPGRAAAVNVLSSLAALRRRPLLHRAACGARCSMVHVALCTDLRALLTLANELELPRHHFLESNGSGRACTGELCEAAMAIYLKRELPPATEQHL